MSCVYTASRADELRLVNESVSSVREILVSVNSQVDEREKQLKLMDIRVRLDARSIATLNSSTFTVSCNLVTDYWHHNVVRLSVCLSVCWTSVLGWTLAPLQPSTLTLSLLVVILWQAIGIIMLYVCLSVRPSVRLSVCLSVRLLNISDRLDARCMETLNSSTFTVNCNLVCFIYYRQCKAAYSKGFQILLLIVAALLLCGSWASRS